jgi:uncharacterized protein
MLHPHTEVRFINDQIGHGVFATRFIPKGTVIWVQDDFDRVFTEQQVRALAPVYQQVLEKYCFRNRLGHWIFCWDNTRYINHSFSPTCIATPYGFEIAVTDMPPGRELTNDYGFFNIIEPLDCFPEPDCERVQAMPDDLLRYGEQWDRQLAAAFRFFDKVDQPLAGLIQPEYLIRANLVARGEASLDSIRCCYFDPSREQGDHA